MSAVLPNADVSSSNRETADARAYPLGQPFPRAVALDRAVAVEAVVATATLVLVVLGAAVAMTLAV